VIIIRTEAQVASSKRPGWVQYMLMHPFWTPFPRMAPAGLWPTERAIHPTSSEGLTLVGDAIAAIALEDPRAPPGKARQEDRQDLGGHEGPVDEVEGHGGGPVRGGGGAEGRIMRA
jgi:hypothetical protein